MALLNRATGATILEGNLPRSSRPLGPLIFLLTGFFPGGNMTLDESDGSFGKQIKLAVGF
jgi:hypothetical protein